MENGLVHDPSSSLSLSHFLVYKSAAHTNAHMVQLRAAVRERERLPRPI